MLSAADLAERGLEDHPDDPALRHRAVLALARSGSTREAAQRYQEYGLGELHGEDYAALSARIAKDEALSARGEARRQLASEAARAYESVYARTGGFYPAINSATLDLIAGREEAARALAAEVLGLLADDDESYYALATQAEAHLVLGDEESAGAALARAVQAAGDDHGALATTRRQLRTICTELSIDQAILDPLSGPAVVHYCGHRIGGTGESGRFPAGAESAARSAIAAEVGRVNPGYAYGSLASGADILWAEALLEHGCELHVVLPFASDEFVRASVAPAGEGWVDRFHRCIEAARDVMFAVDDAYLGDDVLYRYGAELAMGLTLLRARYLDAEVRQLALWDGGPSKGQAGTSIDVDAWRALGLEASIVAPGEGTPVATAGDGPVDQPGAGRVVRALLFGDVKGFSSLADEQLPSFASLVLGAFSEVLGGYGDSIEHQNTWGDALYVVLSEATAAAECALELQAAMGAIDFEGEGLPDLSLRIGGHIGPGFPTWDPVIREMAFMGSHVSRTARIEPVTPAGSVYVTSAFAAALALRGRHDLACDYVGHMPAAKEFGRLRMYRLWRSQA